MTNGNKLILIFAILGVLFSSCSNTPVKPEALDTAFMAESVMPANAAQPEVHPGKKVYDRHCKACHQSNGLGVASVFPPLSPNPYVADKQQIIQIVLEGMKGKIEVDGTTYNGLMTPHDKLSNQELADVVSYVRSSFGNKLEAVTAEEIQAARQ